MPKKMGTNTKAVEARERKATVKKQEQEKKVKAAEDAYWADDDAKLAKKKKQKEDEDRKRAEQLRKKQEAKVLLEQEMNSIKPVSKVPASKVTRAQIEAEVQKRNQAIENINNPAPKPKPPKVMPLEENLNHLMADVEVATNVDEALAILSVKEEAEDRHPEKRMKAAYKAFESANLARIKAENPSLKLSQHKHILQREWQKSPENPLNQIHRK